jgi:hypothetical protein
VSFGVKFRNNFKDTAPRLGVFPPATTAGVHLAKALLCLREGASPHTIPKNQRDALASFTALIKTSWKKIYGTTPKKQDVDTILDLAVVLRFDFDGADFAWGELLLKNNIVQKKSARAAFTTLAHECEERMKHRTSFTIREIRRVLEQNGFVMLAPEDYRTEALKKKSLQLRDSLKGVETIDEGRAPVAAAHLRAIYQGALIAAGGFDRSRAEAKE